MNEIIDNNSFYFDGTILTRDILLTKGFKEREEGNKLSNVYFDEGDYMISCSSGWHTIDDEQQYVIDNISCWVGDGEGKKIVKRATIHGCPMTKKDLEGIIQLCGITVHYFMDKYRHYEIAHLDLPHEEWQPVANLKPSPWDDYIRRVPLTDTEIKDMKCGPIDLDKINQEESNYIEDLKGLEKYGPISISDEDRLTPEQIAEVEKLLYDTSTEPKGFITNPLPDHGLCEPTHLNGDMILGDDLLY